MLVEYNGEFTINQEIIDKLNLFEKQIKEIKLKQEEIREAIKKEMENRNIIGIKTDNININYVDEYDQIRIDNKMLREKYPEIANECSKLTHINSTIKITLK